MVAVDGVGVVIIGRNEGERLVRCLESLSGHGGPCVYVDSGSADGSVGEARRRGFAVVELDGSSPFTAARARCEGFAALCGVHPSVTEVFFVDGDCEVCEGWLGVGVDALRDRGDVGVVCGRVIERRGASSVYGRLMQMEWDGPAGFVDACGGISLMRVDAYQGSGGFDAALPAGEEPELCLRLRRNGWRVLRIECDMVVHDAGDGGFAVWWRRCVRGGYAAALGAIVHGGSGERFGVDRVRRALLWGMVWPVLLVLSCVALLFDVRVGVFGVVGCGVVLGLRWLRMVLRGVRVRSVGDSLLEATALTLDKPAQAIGVVKAWRDVRRGARGSLTGAGPSAAGCGE